MCCLFGIYNYSGKEIKGLSKITNSLAKQATERGTDATGIAYNHNGSLIIHKEPKDIAMAEKADYGFMIWDGSSKGTLNNIINLIERGKKVLVYLSMYDKMLSITSIDNLEKLIKLCPTATMKKYKMLSPHADSQHSVQLSLFESRIEYSGLSRYPYC